MTQKGLEGVVAAQTELSRVFGEEGRLVYRGYEIEDLTEHGSFEEVCFLLWNDDLPNRSELQEFRSRIADAWAVDDDVIAMLRTVPDGTDPMAVLRTAISQVAFYDPDVEDVSTEANVRKAARIPPKMATATAAFHRLRDGKDPVEPDPELGFAQNFLYMLTGERPDDFTAHVMDVALILHAEHGLNASTFAARVTAATLSDMHSAITSAIGTLKGPLHGGANQRVMQMLQEIEEPDHADEWVARALEREEKVMGFGHRVYRTMDPRAPILRDLSAELGEQAGDTRWLDISNRVVDVMDREMRSRDKKIYPNVDFFSASVYYTMGIPRDLFTNIFAMSRAAGWTAHVIEQMKDNRLIRPRAEYVGPLDRKIRPLDERS